jgi:hypothetical protein
MTSRNKREGRFLGYTYRYVWTPKGRIKWVTQYCRGPEGIGHLQLIGKIPFNTEAQNDIQK